MTYLKDPVQLKLSIYTPQFVLSVQIKWQLWKLKVISSGRYKQLCDNLDCSKNQRFTLLCKIVVSEVIRTKKNLCFRYAQPKWYKTTSSKQSDSEMVTLFIVNCIYFRYAIILNTLSEHCKNKIYSFSLSFKNTSGRSNLI